MTEPCVCVPGTACGACRTVLLLPGPSSICTPLSLALERAHLACLDNQAYILCYCAGLLGSGCHWPPHSPPPTAAVLTCGDRGICLSLSCSQALCSVVFFPFPLLFCIQCDVAFCGGVSDSLCLSFCVLFLPLLLSLQRGLDLPITRYSTLLAPSFSLLFRGCGRLANLY